MIIYILFILLFLIIDILDVGKKLNSFLAVYLSVHHQYLLFILNSEMNKYSSSIITIVMFCCVMNDECIN
jgi:hypothetical protein